VTTDQVDEFFAGNPLGRAAFDRVADLLAGFTDSTVTVSRSQVAFRRRRAFAWLWLPGRWVARPSTDVVLSVSLGRHDRSPRFSEVVHPTRAHWMHHLELTDLADVDEEVAGWLREAAERAG